MGAGEPKAFEGKEVIEDMARRELDSVVSYMAVIMENLYKWGNFRDREDVGRSWIKSINNARNELDVIFDEMPSLKRIAQEKESLNKVSHRRRFSKGMPLYLPADFRIRTLD